MYLEDDEQTHKQPASTDPATSGSDPTAPTLAVPPSPPIQDDRPPGPSLGRPAGSGLLPGANWPPGPNSPAPPAAHRHRRWRIGLMATAATAALAAGTIVGHLLWPGSGPTMSPAGSSSRLGASSDGGEKSQSPSGSSGSPIPTKQYPGASGGSNGGSSQSPSGSGGPMSPGGKYPSGSGGSNGPSSQPPGGSSGSPIPTKQYPGASGGSNAGSSQSPSGSGGSMNPNSQYPDGAGG
jgi:hypothetical protein